MNFFTAVLDYQGGTYIYQFYSKLDISGDVERIITNSKGDIRDIIEIYHKSDKNPVLLDGCENVWCDTFIYKENLVLLNFVLTKEKEMVDLVQDKSNASK
ncbi:hypothetical protein [Asticcacaulis excentricus]|uniref:Uncharacterized protein n=1 Tax=Asticcacaulis excentricus (strain ATCC 15261 / DSM 4724 / KCTC 12464 / NCIMB 9791 / VKM B-1370 / CB 48) TaxID=573065 RepID=E8RVD9_ASTEC|nr:hypothetical protein [Asticcacaulis excentricus]ADU15280.1 hypothetical protein Astex_3657 [Asticcacaulis excentricus CB 48]